MTDTTDNVIFEVYGNTAEFATDYGTSGTGFTMSHVQIVKLAFGDHNTTERIYGNNPLPVTISGNSGGIQDIVGVVSGTGSFEIANAVHRQFGGATMIYLAVGGSTSGDPVGITGSIEGKSGGIPVTITGDIQHILNNVMIVGPTGYGGFRDHGATYTIQPSGATADAYWSVMVTGGRRLSSSTDSVTVAGAVSVTGGRQLAAGTDSVSVLGSDLGGKVLTRVYGSAGQTLGVSGDALNVNIINAGVTFSISVASGIGVTNSPGTALYISGNTGAYPVTVRGENAGAIEIAATSPLNVNVNNASLTIDDSNILEKLGSGLSGDIYSKLNTIAVNTSSVSTIRTDLQNGSAKVQISSINRPTTLLVGSKSIGSSGGAERLSTNFILQSGINVKASQFNSGNVLVGNTSLIRNASNGYPLSPGETIFLEIGNANLIYIRSTSGTREVNYIGS